MSNKTTLSILFFLGQLICMCRWFGLLSNPSTQCHSNSIYQPSFPAILKHGLSTLSLSWTASATQRCAVSMQHVPLASPEPVFLPAHAFNFISGCPVKISHNQACAPSVQTGHFPQVDYAAFQSFLNVASITKPTLQEHFPIPSSSSSRKVQSLPNAHPL